ncbi:glycosyltransferase N-terminal domain-containing protein [Chromatiaceae bacterium AAb-1]|nr:glycosyltransferase N-terminal domain-containing protein [Chromatiaceae bacterium AAb-1]
MWKLACIFPESVRWLLFRLLSRIIAAGAGNPAAVSETVSIAEPRRCYWIFCSTIGELNACKPLLEQLYRRFDLLLLTDRDCYPDSYRQQFPRAATEVLTAGGQNIEALYQRYPPIAALVCEIPLMLHDAPCRLSYAVVRYLRQQKISIALVNGWLYQYLPSCTQDRIETQWFGKAYWQSFDLMTVQTDKVRQVMLAKGAAADKVVVTGNMKFDSLFNAAETPWPEQSNSLLQQLHGGDFPVLVAGCVTDVWEYQLLLDALVPVLQQFPELRCVLAPRHPEKPEQLMALRTLLQERQLSFQQKTALSAAEAFTSQLLILDTIGELKAFYQVADLCYVGINHNVLEPLASGKPVIVMQGWNETYPSYPVYELTLQQGLLMQVADSTELSQLLLQQLQQQQPAVTAEKLHTLTGATARNLALLQQYPPFAGGAANG